MVCINPFANRAASGIDESTDFYFQKELYKSHLTERLPKCHSHGICGADTSSAYLASLALASV